jgi:hypothetical protein
LSNGFAPVWIWSPDFRYWIYSFSTSTRVTVQCREAGSPQNYGSSYQITLNGTGILPNSSSWYIYSETFKLLPHSFDKSVATLNKTHIVLPNVDDILNRVERGMLQPYNPELVDLHTVEGVLERATSRSATCGFDVSWITST